MRRLDRPYMNYNGSDDERRVALPRDGTWVKSTIDQIATTQNKLRVNVSQNQESIMMCRQESVVIAENVRSAATMCQQFGEKIMRLEDQIEYDRDSVDSISKQAKQTEAHFTNQYRQLLNKGIQVERNTARLEEEVLRLRQSNEQTNKKFQAINEKINDVMQQLSKQTNAMDVGIQDLRQLSHQTEMDAKKNIRTMVQEIDQKFDNEEQERRDDNSKMLARIDTIQGVVNDLKKMKQYETGNYLKLVEEKDHEYKEELKNFVKKIKSHMNENNVSTSPRDNRSVEDLSRKIREIEKKLVEEEKARTDGLGRLEDETAKHFKKVSGHIIEQLDKLGSSLTNNNLQDESTTKELKGMRKEIEENKKAINRVLRAEITARKTQAQKFNDSIEGFQKHNTQTVQVVKEAIAEMKTYIDKELESKTDLRSDKVEHIIPKLDKRISNVEEKLTLQENDNKRSPAPDAVARELIPALDKKLSDLELKLERQILANQRSTSSIRTPSTPESDQDVLQRLSILEGKLKWHMAVTVTRKAAEGDVIEERMEKQRRVRTAEVLRPQAKTDLPENRRHSSYITARMPMDNSRNSPDMKIATPPRKDRKNSYLQFSRERMFNIEKRLLRLSINQEKTDERVIRLKTQTKRELMIEKRLRNKLIEFINQRCLEGERIKLFVKQFGVHHIKYFIEYTGKKFLLNKWGIYQALRIYQLKKKWLALIGKEPAELTLKEYREIIREEIQKEREQAKKEQKKKTVAPILPDFLSDTSESEPEPEPEPEPEQEKEASVKGDSDLEPEKPVEKPKDGEPVRINYEDADSGDEYIQYKTDDDDYNESDDDFFPQSSEDDEDSKLFSDEDDDDDDETIEETEDEDAENEGETEDDAENEGENEDENKGENEGEKEDDAENEADNKDENEGEKEDNAENEADNGDGKSIVGDEGDDNDDENENNENEDKSEADDDDDDEEDGENTEDDEDETEDDNEDDDDNDDNDDEDDDDDNESNGEEDDEDEDAEGDNKDDDQENENKNESNGDKANGDNNDSKKGDGGASDVKNGQNNTNSNS